MLCRLWLPVNEDLNFLTMPMYSYWEEFKYIFGLAAKPFILETWDRKQLKGLSRVLKLVIKAYSVTRLKMI